MDVLHLQLLLYCPCYLFICMYKCLGMDVRRWVCGQNVKDNQQESVLEARFPAAAAKHDGPSTRASFRSLDTQLLPQNMKGNQQEPVLEVLESTRRTHCLN